MNYKIINKLHYKYLMINLNWKKLKLFTNQRSHQQDLLLVNDQKLRKKRNLEQQDSNDQLIKEKNR